MTRASLKAIGRHIDLQILATSLLALLILLLTVKVYAQSPIIKIDGSSTVFPITEAMAEEFQTSKKGAVKVTVGISGTGGGFKKFCRGEIDIQDASRPIDAKEMEACKKAGIKYFELPVAYDALVVVVNPKADWVTAVTVEELKKMWEPAAQGKITKWNQVNPKWPDQPLKLYGPGADSGTFDYFTEAAVGKAKSSRGDYTASEDDNTIVTGVATDKYSIGYFGMSYYTENQKKLKAIAIINPKTLKPVMATKDTVEKGEYQPFSRPLFIYVSESSYKKPEVKEFVTFYLQSANQLVPEVKYIGLPEKAYKLGEEHLTKSKLGTKFGGHSEVGLKIEDLMKREGTL
ncbi:MAG: phosphate ABC transporter substrate-binding protein [Oligoflexia bacterium]|nr:MAG: phosphate ABC transporter substrate-binding protein [Oligoflexia bacterium]